MPEIDTSAMIEHCLDIQVDIPLESLETIKTNEFKASGNENKADENMVT